MIKLADYITAIDGVNCTPTLSLEKVEINGAYVCDMLSDVWVRQKKDRSG